MTDDTTSSKSLNANNRPETAQSNSVLLQSGDIAEQEGWTEAAPVLTRPGTTPGRRPLFRS
jgi:hypothetical protein